MVSSEFGSKVRLYFLLSSAAHFVKSLEADGFTVIYQKAATTVDGLKQVRADHGDLPIIAATPNSLASVAPSVVPNLLSSSSPCKIFVGVKIL